MRTARAMSFGALLTVLLFPARLPAAPAPPQTQPSTVPALVPERACAFTGRLLLGGEAMAMVFPP